MVGRKPKRREIKRIEDSRNRKVTFSRRRKVLFQNAQKLGQNFGAEVAVIAVSETDKVYSFGSPSVGSVVSRYLAHKAQNPEQELHDDQTNSGPDGGMSGSISDDEMHLDLSLSMTSAEEKVGYRPVQERHSESNADVKKEEQDRIVENFQMYELDELMTEMEEMKKKAEDRAYY